MINRILDDLVENAKDFYYGPAMPGLICAGFYGTIAANGFYRGFHNMPIMPEHLNQVTKGDITAIAVAGAGEIAMTIDGLTTHSYFDGARCAAGMVGLPIIGAFTHGIGYALGKVVQHIS